MKTKLLILAAIAALYSSPLLAAKGWANGHVTDIMLSETDFGGCVARIDNNISKSGANCPGKWVSFSCDGTHNSKDIAYHMLDIAQVSLLLGNKVWFYVDDTKLHNTYCTVETAQLLNAP